MMFGKLNNIDGLLNLEHVFKYSQSGIYFFTTKSPAMQRMVADELSIFNIALLDFSMLHGNYSYYSLEKFADLNEDKKIFVVINLQNAINDDHDIINFNLSRDMIISHKKIWVFGMLEYLEEKLSLKALDLYSYVRLNIGFEDETIKENSNFQFIYSEEEFLDPALIDELLESYKYLIKNKIEADEESISLSDTYENIASLYNKKFQYDESLKWYFKAFEIKEKVLGREHQSTATVYNNIGSIYSYKGNYDKALQYHFNALEIRAKILGKENLDTATSYNNIGRVYMYKGDYDKALEFYFKALETREKVLGKENSDTATSYDNIGRAYCYKGEYEKALEYHFKAIKTKEKVLGKENPDTATSYDNVGKVYGDKGECEKALEYLFRALEIREKVQGKENPYTAMSYNNIGVVYSNNRKYEKALEFCNKALEIRKKVLGEDHPDTIKTYDNIIEINKNIIYQ